MLVLKLEMWPDGDRTQARDLGTLEIANMGGSMERGDYKYEHWPTNANASGFPSQWTGCILQWDRSRSAWALVFTVLEKMGVSGWQR